MLCPGCHADLTRRHVLEARGIPPMANHSKIIYPACADCGLPIARGESTDIAGKGRKVLLLTGTAGAGKTALGQLIERRHGYVFIDGDAIQKRVNFFARHDPSYAVDYTAETIRTLLVVLALGYDAVVGYVIGHEALPKYLDALGACGITPVIRVLIPERSVCLARDAARDCWTAGAQWVDRWYDEMRAYLTTYPSLCVDTSEETLEETYQKHFRRLV